MNGDFMEIEKENTENVSLTQNDILLEVNPEEANGTPLQNSEPEELLTGSLVQPTPEIQNVGGEIEEQKGGHLALVFILLAVAV